MSQSLSNVLVHVVFSTKDRRLFLRDLDIRKQMFALIGGASKTLKCQPLLVGGVDDHIHMLARQARTIALADWVKELKRVTIKCSGPIVCRRPKAIDGFCLRLSRLPSWQWCCGDTR